MNKKTENLQIGTYGWQNDDWRGYFYPEELPTEWMLDFYGNSYRTVLVPESVWLAWDKNEMEETCDAVEGEFCFYFEILATSNGANEMLVKQIAHIVNVFKERACGVVVFTEEEVDVNLYRPLPVTQVSTAQKLTGWQWTYNQITCSGAVCGVLLQQELQPKLQTQVLQSFMESLPKERTGAPLLIKADEIDMKQIFNLKTIGEFLGY